MSQALAVWNISFDPSTGYDAALGERAIYNSTVFLHTGTHSTQWASQFPSGVGAGITAISGGTTNATGLGVSFANGSGVTWGVNGNTITASVAGGAGNTGSISAGTASASLGQVVFSNSNGMSFGVNGQTVTGSYTVPTVPAQPNVSAGTTNVQLGNLSFANGSGVTWGLNGSTVTGSIAAGATATGNVGAIAAGTQTGTSGTVIFSNSNGLTFGMAGSATVTASYTVPTVPAQPNVSAGTTNVQLGNLSFSNGSGVTWGLNGSTVTASVAAGAVGSFGMSNLGTTYGTSGTVTGRAVFVGSDGIYLSQSVDAIATASVTITIGQPQGSQFFPFGMAHNTVSLGNGTIFMAPFRLDRPLVASRFDNLVSISISTSSNSSHAVSLTANWGIYTLNVSSFSSLYSGQYLVSWTNTSNNSLGSLSGVRRLSGTFNQVTMSPGDYFLAYGHSIATAGANWASIWGYIITQLSNQYVGDIGVASNSSLRYALGLGIYTVASAGMPTSIHVTNIQAGNAGGNARSPYVVIGATT